MSGRSFEIADDSLRTIRMQGLLRDEDSLKSSSSDLAVLDADIASTALELERLSVKLRHLRSYRAKLSEQNYTLRRRVEAEERALYPFQHLPGDVLAVIFSVIAEEPDDYWQELDDGRFNETRAQAPFNVAAVCRLWRSVALSTSHMWNYAGIPDLEEGEPEDAKKTLSRIKTIVSRSGTASLDVLFEDISHNESDCYVELFEILYPELYRWKRCKISSCIDFPDLADYLRGPAPRLEELYVVQEHPEQSTWLDDLGSYLSNNPPLRHLIIGHMPMLPGSSPSLQSLDLRLSEATPSDALWKFFHNTTNLTVLTLTVCDAEILHSTETIEIPSLQTLSMKNDAARIPIRYPKFLRLPSLRDLCIHIHWPSTAGDNLSNLGEFFDYIASEAKLLSFTIGLTELNSAEGTFIASQKLFQGCTSLKISLCTVYATFWDCLCDVQALGNLIHLAIDTIFFEDSSPRQFLRFLRWRKANKCGLVTDIQDSGLSVRDYVEVNYTSKWD